MAALDPAAAQISTVIRHWAAATPDAPVLVGPGGDDVTYGGLARWLSEITPAFAALGITETDVVGLALGDRPAMAVANMIVAAAATTAPLNPRWDTAELEGYLGLLQPGAVVVGDGTGTVIRAACARLGIPTIEATEAGDLGLFTIEGSPLAAEAPRRRVDPSVNLIAPTSGTTGRPRMVPVTHANLFHATSALSEACGLGPDDRCLVLSPLFRSDTTSSLWAGGSIVLPDELERSKLLELLLEHRPTWYTAGPAVHRTILDAAADRGAPDVTLRFVHSSGSALPRPMALELEALFGCPLVEGYGMAETYRITTNRPGERRLGSVGKPVGAAVALLGEDGTPVSRGAGEIAVRGPAVVAGYIDDPDATAAAFADGWFRSGDIGELDEDGFLFIVGRRKELLNIGGEMVSPVLIDDVLCEHPFVREAATFSIPHRSLGEVAGAALVLVPDAPDGWEPELRSFIGTRLSPTRRPRRLLRTDEIPKGSTGKVDRAGVAALDRDARRARLADRHHAPAAGLVLRLAGIWTELLDAGDGLSLDDDFFEVGGDSLLAVALAATIAERLGIEAAAADIVAHPVLADQAAALEQRALAPAGARSPLVELRPGSALGDVFLIPGVGGNLAAMQRIAHHLALDARIYGFEAPGLYPGERPVPTIPWLARRYAREILETVDGPYAVVGGSFGGTLAHEIVRRTARAGRPPTLLVMIDSLSPVMARQQPDGDGRRTPRQRVGDVADWLTLRRDAADRRLAARRRIDRCAVIHGTALLLHRPRRIDVPTAILTSSRNRVRSRDDAALGWGPWIPADPTIVELEGEHEALIGENAHATIAALEPLLRNALDIA